MFGFFSDVKKRLFALEQKIEVVWQHLFTKVEEVVQHAEQNTEASTNDGSGSAQPEVRQEDGDSAVGSEGVQSSGHAENEVAHSDTGEQA